MPVIGIKHFVSGSQTCFGKRTQVHSANSQNTGQNVRLSFRVRLMQHAFIALACGARFVGINTGYQYHTFFYFFLQTGQAVGVFADRFLVVCRAGTYNDKKFV